MQKVLLDSTVMVHLSRKSKEMLEVLRHYGGNEQCISVVTYAEIISLEKRRRKADARKLLQPFTILPVNDAVLKQVIAQSKIYEVPQTQIADFLIACTAIALKIELITANEKHFSYKGLMLHPYSFGQ